MTWHYISSIVMMILMVKTFFSLFYWIISKHQVCVSPSEWENKDWIQDFLPTFTNYREKSVAEPADITPSPPTFCLNRQEYSAATAWNFCGSVISVTCEKQNCVTAFLYGNLGNWVRHMASLSHHSYSTCSLFPPLIPTRPFGKQEISDWSRSGRGRLTERVGTPEDEMTK